MIRKHFVHLLTFLLLAGMMSGLVAPLHADDTAPTTDEADVPLLAPVDGEISAADITAGAYTIQVNVKTDQWDPNNKPSNDKSNCSLREALQAMYMADSKQGCGNVPQDASEYVLDMVAGTHKLTLADELPNINRKVSISGKNKTVTIDGGGSGQIGGGDERDKSIFMVKQGGILVLKEIILTNGMSAAGGAIRNEGVTTIRDSILKDNNSQNLDYTSSGGAIYSTGSLFIEKTLFQENNALDEGGAIWSGGGDLVIKKSSFVKNRSVGGGGAIRCAAGGTRLCEISESTFVENKVQGLNGANYDIMTDDAIGGAIKNIGRFQGTKLSFQKNSTEGTKGGGAFANKSSESMVYLIDSAFEDNHADADPPNVPNAFGGAVYNESDLHLVRVSIHNNKATVAGGVFNRGDELIMANVTIANNEATYHGGFANGSPLHQNSEFGIARLYHVTHTENKDQVGSKSEIATLKQLNVYLANSIIDGGCLGGKFYTDGGNIFGKACSTTEDPMVTPFGDVTLSDGNVGTQGLTFNGGPELDAGFYTQRLNGDSPAIDAGRNDTTGCLHPDVNKRDARNAERDNNPPNKCDSGAFEQGSIPPKFKAEIVPGENKDTSIGGGSGGSQGTVYFRVYQDLGMSFQQQVLDITNDGGGSIQYEAVLEDSDSGRFALAGDLIGGLLKGTHKQLTLTCTSSQKSVRYGMLLIKTDMQDKKEIRYKLSCVTTDFNHPSMAPNQEPGPIASGESAPGTNNSTSFEVGAHSGQPTNVNAATTDSGNGAVSVGIAKQVVNTAGDAQPMASDAPITLNNGERATVTITCKPPTPGLFFGTVQLTTNDPDRPTLNYNVSCEGAYPPKAETLNPAGLYQGVPVVPYWGIGISPDGKQLLAGSSSDNTLQHFSRNPATGELTEAGNFSLPNMARIYDIAYSADGNYVYYTSQTGDGVAVLSRAGDGSLSQTQVVTSETKYFCGIVNNILKFCNTPSLDGAFALDLSPDGKNLYVVADSGSGLTVMARNTLSGTIYPVQAFTRTIEGANVLGGAGDVLVSPDGRNVYVSTRSEDTMVVFTRDPDTGKVHFLQALKDNVGGYTTLDYLGNMAISSDGKFLYVPSYLDDAINVFSRAPGDGALQLVEVIPNLDGVFAVDLSHDADNLRLVASLYTGNSIRVYQRDRVSGKLTFIEGYTDGANGNLNVPVRLISSSDDKSVYTTLFGDKGVRLLQSKRPKPELYSMSPASIKVAAGNFTLSVNGSRFVPDSVITWNDVALPTTFVNEHYLQASVPGANIAAAGNATIKVRSSAPGGGDSTALLFAITAPNQAGIPSIESINPPAITPGSGDLALLIKGFNFTAQTVAQLNGKNVATTYVNESTLMALLLASDLQVDGPMGITVVNSTALLASDASDLDATVKSKPARFETAASGEVMQPAISVLSPSSSKVSTETIWITISGYNFSNAADTRSQAYWNGSPRATIVIDSKTLSFQATATDLAKAGKATVKVLTPGTEYSNSASFTILNANDNPLPKVISYEGTMSGSGWKVTINGENFVSGAKVRFNGSERSTTFVSPYELTISLNAAEGKSGGLLRVVNPTPGGGNSNDLVMTSLGTIRTLYLPLVTKVEANLNAADESGTLPAPSVEEETTSNAMETQSEEVEAEENTATSWLYLPVVNR